MLFEMFYTLLHSLSIWINQVLAGTFIGKFLDYANVGAWITALLLKATNLLGVTALTFREFWDGGMVYVGGFLSLVYIFFRAWNEIDKKIKSRRDKINADENKENP